jgi:parallel beta-helix repeat protein
MILCFVAIIDIVMDYTSRVTGNTLYVNETGSGGAYTSIQDAINAAIPGDTVFVFNGTYFEKLVVNKVINLEGMNRENTTINGGGSGIVITVNNAIAVNITGFNVTNGSIGMRLYSSNHTISRNIITANIDNGVEIDTSSNINIIDNIISYNKEYGFRITSSANILVKDNNISSNNYYGIYLDDSTFNTFSGNNISNNNNGGLYVRNSPNQNITNNTFIYNGIAISGNSLEHWNTHSIDTTNTVNVKPVYYWKNQTAKTIPPGAGQIILANCTNITIQNQELTYGQTGIGLGFSSNNSIKNNNISWNKGSAFYITSFSNDNIIEANNASFNSNGIYIKDSNGTKIMKNIFHSQTNYGIFLEYSNFNDIIQNNISINGIHGIDLRNSEFNNITGNMVHSCDFYGIFLLESSSNIVEYNTIHSNKQMGIQLHGSHYNRIERNNISNNLHGLNFIWHSMKNDVMYNNVTSNNSTGIYLVRCDSNNIIANNISWNNITGIRCAEGSDGNYILQNNISHNNNGISFHWSDNFVYHNNFINNSNQAIEPAASSSIWDNGYPSGGNYWSDYSGFDNYRGPNQDQPGSDGIGDTNYSIDSDSVDNYPLMNPYSNEPIENYTILKHGWNLISIPLIQENQDLRKVLEMIDGWYDAIQLYDPNDPWKHHKVGKPFGNDLFELNETTGFWIHITNPGDTIFLYNGTQPTLNKTIQLLPGWNMVGYPSSKSYNRTEGLNNLTFGDHVDAIWSYDAATQKWEEMGESDYFQIGKGYYIHAESKCEWEVPL